MAKGGEDDDDLFKSLISNFFRPYLELFHRDLLAILKVEDADWSNTELRFPDFGQTTGASKKKKRFADIVAKIPYLDPEHSPYKGTKSTDVVIKTWCDQGKDAGLEEGHQKGRTQGHKEGHKEGMQEGLKEGIQRTVRLLIARRFGSSEKVENAVAKLTADQLQDLAAALLDPAKTLEDLNMVRKRANGKAKR